MNLIAFELVSTIIATLIVSALAACDRKPQGATSDRSPVDDNFQIHIEGNPVTYIPGQQYNMSLSCTSGMKYTSFTMVVECENCRSSDYDMLGHFKIIDFAETRFSALCENMIESANGNAKSRVDVAWVAPTNPNSGCIFIRAAVLQHRNVWFIDDGFLSKRICAEEIDVGNTKSLPMNSCCACDEAKYEIFLERRWSRNTHAKDYPIEYWRTRFSELVGASHSFDYRFWEYGSHASQGLQELAEHGSGSTLESEIKENSNAGRIRTIVKAPGILYRQNIMGTTLATLRVDPKHHLVSLVTKIDPSPDWVLGVAGLELCLLNCTWVERKLLNLYPWDVGTDDGPSYMSPDQPQVPPDVIRRITSTFPSDHRSPFYDDSGAPMKPMATLLIVRKKLYERECEYDVSTPLECATHPWSNWSDCSTMCGRGTQHRIRTYKDPRLADSYRCQITLRQTMDCLGVRCALTEDGGEEARSGADERATAECALTEWSSWSPCSNECGQGLTTRQRSYVFAHAKNNCKLGFPVDLEQTQNCIGEDCGGLITQTDGHYNTNDSGPQNTQRQPENQLNRAGETYRYGLSFEQPRTERQNTQVRPNLATVDSYMPSNERGYFDVAGDFRPEGNEQLVHQEIPIHRLGNTHLQDTKEGRLSTGQQLGTISRYDMHETQKISTLNEDNTENDTALRKHCFIKPFHTYHICKKSSANVRNYWFYDADDHECKIFTADTCDKNKNKFQTLKSCEDECRRPEHSQKSFDYSGFSERF